MAIMLLHNDCVLDDSRLLSLGFSDISSETIGEAVSWRAEFDVKKALDVLGRNPDLGAYFLSVASGNGTVYWTGEHARDQVDGWRTVLDLDLAKQVVLDTVDRKYRFRKFNVEQVSSQTFDMMLKAYAVADAGQDLFRGALPGAAQKVDDKVVTLDMEGLRAQCSDVDPELERSAPAEVSVPEVSVRPGEVEFTVSKGGYSRRTYENAQADDVDFTFAFAVDNLSGLARKFTPITSRKLEGRREGKKIRRTSLKRTLGKADSVLRKYMKKF